MQGFPDNSEQVIRFIEKYGFQYLDKYPLSTCKHLHDTLDSARLTATHITNAAQLSRYSDKVDMWRGLGAYIAHRETLEKERIQQAQESAQEASQKAANTSNIIAICGVIVGILGIVIGTLITIFGVV